jgi:ribosomal protein S18 acetylase RimI-like enzyme
MKVKACSLLAGLGDAHGWDGAGDVRVDVGGFAVMLGHEDWLLLGGRVVDSQTQFPAFVGAFGGEAFEKETVWSLDEFAAVAMWIPPGAEADGDAIVAALSESVSAHKHADTFAVLGQMDAAHPKDPHWYLPWLGIDCPRQGAGLGSDLLQQCLVRVDADHSPAFLETPNPRTVPFYERHGFRVISVSQAGACPPVTSMLRPAR